MKRRNLINKILIGAWAMLVVTLTYAGTPLWTYSTPSPATTTASAESTATIQYTVTNQSTKTKNLILQATPGLTASPCHLATKGSTCALTLTVNGSGVPQEGIHTGPVLCEKDNPSQCYQPSRDNVLQIRLTNQPPVARYTVTSIGDAHVTATPASQQVLSGSTTTFTMTPNAGYTVTASSTCGGGSLSGTTYTTGPITAACTVIFTSSQLTFTVSGADDAHVTVAPASQSVAYGATTTLTVTPATGYTATASGCGGSLTGTTYTTGPITSACTVTAASTAQTFTVIGAGDAHVTVAPASQSVAYGATTTLTVTPATGYTATASGCGGSLTGTTYTTGPITSACTVTASGVAVFPVAEGPSNVIAVPGNGQVTVSWTAPTNTGTGTVSSYTVTYGPTSGTTFTTAGCTTSSTSCTVSGLTNGTAYTFAVTTTTTLSGAHETGPATFSSSVTPTAELAASPSTLALSSLASSHSARTITLTNNSSSPITLSAVPTTYSDFSPDLPSDVTISSTCSTSTSLAANGGSCTVTITPGTTASNNSSIQACTNGTAPETSVFNVTTGPAVAINAVVLGYGCQYQGGYLFSIDDTAPTTSSIGGKVVATADQSSSVQWSPGGVFDSIWGIDDASTPTNPSPNASSSVPATLKLGQLNCNAVNDGACATTNTFVYYGTGTNYAVGLCKQALNNSGATCSGGSSCYTDWHLPSTCELGPFGSTGTNIGDYPSLPGSQSCSSGSTNIQNELVSTSIVNLSGDYWSSTEYSGSPQGLAWFQYFAASGGSNLLGYFKDFPLGVRCSRALTL